MKKILVYLKMMYGQNLKTMFFSANTTFNELKSNEYHPASGHKNGYLGTTAANSDMTSISSTDTWGQLLGEQPGISSPTDFIDSSPSDDVQVWWQNHDLSMPDGHTLIILDSEGVDQDNLGLNIDRLVFCVTGIGRYYYLTSTNKPDGSPPDLPNDRIWNSEQYHTQSNRANDWDLLNDGSGNMKYTLNKLQYGPYIDEYGELEASEVEVGNPLPWYQTQFWLRNLDESKYIGDPEGDPWSVQNKYSTQQFGNEYTFPRKWNLTCIDQINFQRIMYNDSGNVIDELDAYGNFISNNIKSERLGTSLIDFDDNYMNHKVILCLPGHVNILMPGEDYPHADTGNQNVPSNLDIYQRDPDAETLEIISPAEILVNGVRVSESTFNES